MHEVAPSGALLQFITNIIGDSMNHGGNGKDHVPSIPTYQYQTESNVSVLFRRLQRDDFQRGFPGILSQLTTLGDINETGFQAYYDKLYHDSTSYQRHFIIVCYDPAQDSIIGSATLLVEYKFIHGLSPIGHVEDVVVDSDIRNKSIGSTLIHILTTLSQHLGCYKTILNCTPELEGFYGKLGFAKRSIQMAQYHDEHPPHITSSSGDGDGHCVSSGATPDGNNNPQKDLEPGDQSNDHPTGTQEVNTKPRRYSFTASPLYPSGRRITAEDNCHDEKRPNG